MMVLEIVTVPFLDKDLMLLEMHVNASSLDKHSILLAMLASV